MSAPGAPRRVTVLGAGEIGSGWAALFALHGAHVLVFDRDPSALRRARAALERARSLCPGATPQEGTISLATGAGEAARGAEWIQESLPESLPVKRSVLEALDGVVDPEAIVASSTSTLTASSLAAGRPYASRMLIAHPLHPVYVVPVVELCAGPETAAATLDRAVATLRAVGREPVVVRGHVSGLVSNRLTAALLREALDLISRGVIDAAGLDRLVARGIATGWAAEGPLRTEMIGTGAIGSAAVLETPLSELWSSLATWPSLDPDRRAALADELTRYSETTGLATRRGDETAHAVGEGAWAETLARILRATESGVTRPVL